MFPLGMAGWPQALSSGLVTPDKPGDGRYIRITHKTDGLPLEISKEQDQAWLDAWPIGTVVPFEKPGLSAEDICANYKGYAHIAGLSPLMGLEQVKEHLDKLTELRLLEKV